MSDKYRPKGSLGLRDLSGANFRETSHYEKLDLHGARYDDVRPRVEKFLARFFSGGNTTVQIIHGHGEGVVKKTLYKMLTELKKADPKNPHQLKIADFRPYDAASVLVDLD